MRRRRIPPRIHQIVFRVRRPLRRSETEKLRLLNLSRGSQLANLRFLRQRLRPHIRRKQHRVPFLQTKIRRPLVAEKHIAVSNEQLINAHHRSFGSRFVPHALRIRHRRTKSMRFKERLDPLEPPLQWAHHPVFVARRQPVFPVVHPPRISLFKHMYASILSAQQSKGVERLRLENRRSSRSPCPILSS